MSAIREQKYVFNLKVYEETEVPDRTNIQRLKANCTEQAVINNANEWIQKLKD